MTVQALSTGFFPRERVPNWIASSAPAHREVDAHAWLMFMSVRALLRNGGMPRCESDCEAGHVMALLNA